MSSCCVASSQEALGALEAREANARARESQLNQLAAKLEAEAKTLAHAREVLAKDKAEMQVSHLWDRHADSGGCFVHVSCLLAQGLLVHNLAVYATTLWCIG